MGPATPYALWRKTPSIMKILIDFGVDSPPEIDPKFAILSQIMVLFFVLQLVMNKVVCGSNLT